MKVHSLKMLGNIYCVAQVKTVCSSGSVQLFPMQLKVGGVGVGFSGFYKRSCDKSRLFV